MIINETARIYVSTVKNIEAKLPDYYEPIQAGSVWNHETSYMGDDTGQNISYKNSKYCELTVLYWIWKNQSHDIMGLTHHRRFFFNKKMVPHILNIKEIHRALKKYEMIIPKPISVGRGIEFQYQQAHKKEDYDLCREIIIEEYPEYISYFDKNSQLPYLHPYNMLITRRKILDDYCSFLFPILEKLENQIDVSTRDSYQQRAIGFLAERLFQVWLLKHEQLKSIEFPVYNLEQPIAKQKKEIF